MGALDLKPIGERSTLDTYRAVPAQRDSNPHRQRVPGEEQRLVTDARRIVLPLRSLQLRHTDTRHADRDTHGSTASTARSTIRDTIEPR
jgi:hypothetical protein